MIGGNSAESTVSFSVWNITSTTALFHQVGVIVRSRIDYNLLERLGVHEIATHIVFVQVLVRTAFYANRFDGNPCREGIVDRTAVFQVLEFRTDECRPLARFYMLKINDLHGLPVEFDAHSDFNICCCCHLCNFFVSAKIAFFSQNNKPEPPGSHPHRESLHQKIRQSQIKIASGTGVSRLETNLILIGKSVAFSRSFSDQ